MKTDPKTTIDNSGIAFLQSHDGGACAHELGQKFREVNLAAKAQRKKGKLTIEIELVPGKSNALEIAYKITAKIPKAEPPTAFYFVCEDGSLSRNDPSQRELAFHAIEGGRAPDAVPPQPVAV